MPRYEFLAPTARRFPEDLRAGNALWSDTAYSDVVPTEDSTIRVAQRPRPACSHPREHYSRRSLAEDAWEASTCPALHRSAEPNTLAVRIDFDQRAELIAAEPSVYYVTDHYVNYLTVLVRLSRINHNSLRDLLGMAWRFVSSKTKASGRRHATSVELYMSAVLPVSIAGLVLIGLAVGLFIIDIFAPTHGILTVGGTVAFFLGSMMLFDRAEPFLSPLARADHSGHLANGGMRFLQTMPPS